ncbi:hypothetical protein AABB24_034135, partial [Solanum stoloniferum]
KEPKPYSNSSYSPSPLSLLPSTLPPDWVGHEPTSELQRMPSPASLSSPSLFLPSPLRPSSSLSLRLSSLLLLRGTSSNSYSGQQGGRQQQLRPAANLARSSDKPAAPAGAAAARGGGSSLPSPSLLFSFSGDNQPQQQPPARTSRPPVLRRAPLPSYLLFSVSDYRDNNGTMATDRLIGDWKARGKTALIRCNPR